MEWLTHLLAFAGGGGAVAAVAYFVAPKQERDRLALEREKHEAEQQRHVRERRIAQLTKACEVSAATVAMCSLPSMNAPDDFKSEGRKHVVLYATTMAGVCTDFVLEPDDARTLMGAAEDFSDWHRIRSDDDESALPSGWSEPYVTSVLSAQRVLRRLLDAT